MCIRDSCYLFATTWSVPVEDEEPIVASILGKTTLMDRRYRIEEMALIDALNQSAGKTYTAACPKTFGGQEYAGCKVSLPLITVTGALTSVTSRSIVLISALAEAADYFAYGTLQLTSGANAGLKPIEVKRHEADGTIEVFEPFYLSLIHICPAFGRRRLCHTRAGRLFRQHRLPPDRFPVRQRHWPDGRSRAGSDSAAQARQRRQARRFLGRWR